MKAATDFAANPALAGACKDLLEEIAQKLWAAREVLFAAADADEAHVPGALALLNCAGALADRGAKALGGLRVMADGEWLGSVAVERAFSVLNQAAPAQPQPSGSA
jgi:hypothetical protein